MYRGEERLSAPPKVLDLLRVLLEAPGHVVLRDQLQTALWPDVTVEEGNLSKLVFLLRQTLAIDPSWTGAIETIPKRGYRFVGAVERRDGEPSAAARPLETGHLLAVLPFSDPNPSDQHLSEGLAERILNHLVKVPGLSVLARASSFRFGMGAHDLPAIANQLGVGLLVDGRFQRTPSGIQVAVRLVDVRQETTLWSSEMEARVADLLLLDAPIASSVVEALGLSLPAPIRRRESSPLALQKVVQARYFWNRRPGDVVAKAIRCYEEALALDPDDAEAWAGLADVYVTLGSWEAGVLPHAEGQSKAMVHASRALALDPTLADAHATLGYAALHYGWDVSAAETSFRSALRLGPQCVTAHHWYSHCLAAVGRVRESLEESRECLRLDPMNLLMSVHLAWHHHMAREPDQVLLQSERVVAMDPGYHWGHYFRAWGLEGLGEPGRALEAARDGERVAGGSLVMTALVGRAHAVAGDAPEALAIIGKLQEAGGEHDNFAYEIALIQLGLGETKVALDWLERARQHRSGWMAYLAVDPRLDPLRAEPRFRALETGVGLTISGDAGRPSGPRR